MNHLYETLLLEVDDHGIATLTIDRPEKLNALNNEVLAELDQAFKVIRQDEQIVAVIITGTGPKAFVAGADISELAELNRKAAEATSRRGQQIFQRIENSPKPVIAAVNGYALGGGAELAMACHLRVAGDNAVFGLPEVGLGLIPGYGGTQRLPKIVGRARALEMILTAKQVKAQEALQMGLINKLTEEDPVGIARDLIRKILENAPLSIQRAIEAVHQADAEAGFEKESALFGSLCETDDFQEGTAAFLEKRKPNFKGK